MVLTSTVFGKTEVEWSKELSETIFPGEAEYRLPDGTRIDILTEDACWEVEWCSHKVYESIGQALYYQASTGKQGGGGGWKQAAGAIVGGTAGFIMTGNPAGAIAGAQMGANAAS